MLLNSEPSNDRRSPQSPGASSLVKVRNSAPLQHRPGTVVDVVELTGVVEVVVAGGSVDEGVAPGTVEVVVAASEVEVVVAGATVEDVVLGAGPSPGHTAGGEERVAMKRPVSLRRIVPPNCAQ
jgi:hypothetical protein